MMMQDKTSAFYNSHEETLRYLSEIDGEYARAERTGRFYTTILVSLFAVITLIGFTQINLLIMGIGCLVVAFAYLYDTVIKTQADRKSVV